jgi:hypothetical protein
MHSNAVLLERLFSSLNRKDDKTIASCYHLEATFQDIAFDLHGRNEIHDMWRMICAGDIRATFEVVHADDETGRVRVVVEYTFSDTGRKVRNVIDSRFTFKDHLVVEHRDSCDAKAWAAMAIGGVKGFLAGRVAPMRRFKARRKLKKFVQQHATTA